MTKEESQSCQDEEACTLLMKSYEMEVYENGTLVQEIGIC